MTVNINTPVLLPPIRATKAQKTWLEQEKKRTGNTLAVIIRGLIQEKMEHKRALPPEPDFNATPPKVVL